MHFFAEIYLQPKVFGYGPDYDSGEIRIAFSPGNEVVGRELHGGVILGTSTEGRHYGIKKTNAANGLWSDEFHTYQLQWGPGTINLYNNNNIK